MKIRHVRVKSILGKSSIGDYCINPYVGCTHACIYCYADYYTKKFSGHKEGWGSFVDVKINAPEILVKEIVKKRRGIVYISSLTDPYQPIEKKYEITRNILEILARYNWPVVIQTKSSLILRDLDVLSRFKEIEVGFTIISLDENKCKKLERFAPSPSERIKALKKLKESGIKTFVFIGPIMPFTKLEEIKSVVQKTKEFADKFYFDKLNIKPRLLEKIKKIKEYEELNVDEMKIYYDGIKEEIYDLAKRESIEAKILF